MIFDAKRFLCALTTQPGVYQMLGKGDVVLYVGKAKNLKERLSSYFQASGMSLKTKRLMEQVQRIEITVTHENEALLLENNLIKQFKPRYNVLLRDDKSYPYILLSDQHSFPRLDFYRGKRKKVGRLFGPYPNVQAVRETLNLLQKIFRIRQCNDVFFSHRSRPCLQYQIQRCTAPCVGFITAEAYRKDVENAVAFLEGKSQSVLQCLIQEMEAKSDRLEYEQAARVRDQIILLRQIQEKQSISQEHGDVDVVALAQILPKHTCVYLITIRAGQVISNKSFFPEHTEYTEPEEILSAFLSQYYLNQQFFVDIPRQIVTSHPVKEADWLMEMLSKLSKHSVHLQFRVRGQRAVWLRMAERSAIQTLKSNFSLDTQAHHRLLELQHLLNLPNLPELMQCFDVSHMFGEATTASCVTFLHGKSNKKAYRRFNIQGVIPGDDYGALKQALTRHFTHLKKQQGQFPDLLVIDGGKGQLRQAKVVLEELQVVGVTLLAVAKGPSRKPGLETLFLAGRKEPLACPPDAKALHLVQEIRDEAHRFAIQGHRQKRAKTRKMSLLETIPGIGSHRRQLLLRHFGGLQEIRRATPEALAAIPGISQALAQKIYSTFHRD